MRRRLVLIAALAVVAALAFPHGALADNGDDGAGEAEFHGVIESLPDPGPVGDWTVSGVTVHVTDATELQGNSTGDCNDDGDNDNEGDDEGDGDNGDGDDGDLRSTSADDPGDDGDDETCDETVTFAVGDDVKVEGVLEADGSITASQIEADDQGDDENGDGDDSDDGTLVMKGTAQRIVQSASHVGLWKVSSQQIRVLKATKIVRNGHVLRRGAHLRVSGKRLPSGTIRATRIAIVR